LNQSVPDGSLRFWDDGNDDGTQAPQIGSQPSGGANGENL